MITNFEDNFAATSLRTPSANVVGSPKAEAPGVSRSIFGGNTLQAIGFRSFLIAMISENMERNGEDFGLFWQVLDDLARKSLEEEDDNDADSVQSDGKKCKVSDKRKHGAAYDHFVPLWSSRECLEIIILT